MKKLLAVLAVIMLAAFAAPAFAATNPFMDVPASHWAYDAVAQLAARGVISGYPDGTFKGPQPATRYEIASIIARSLAYVDADKASKTDVEMMRRLIVEFSDELTALGVTVDGLDSRLAVLEEDLGGWRIYGEFEFNVKIGSNGNLLDMARNREPSSASGLDGVVDFDLDKYRVWLSRRINETTSFTARLGKGDIGANGHSNSKTAVAWDFYYITTKLGYDITLDAGRFNFNWEDDLGFQADDDAYVGDVTAQQFRLTKDWGLASMQLVFGRLGDDFAGRLADNFEDWLDFYDRGGTVAIPATNAWNEAFLVAGLADFTFNEQFQAGLIGYYVWSEQSVVADLSLKEYDLGVYAKFNFTPSVELKAIYYYQNREDLVDSGREVSFTIPGTPPINITGPVMWEVDDNFSAWKAILKVDQELLKFTDLQIEFSRIDNGFHLWTDPYSSIGNNILTNKPFNNNTTTVVGLRAAQKWGESRWDSWIRYYQADYDTAGIDDVKNIGLGIGYQLNPAVHFELAVDYIDFGDSTTGNRGIGSFGNESYRDEDIVFRFQTKVSF